MATGNTYSAGTGTGSTTSYSTPPGMKKGTSGNDTIHTDPGGSLVMACSGDDVVQGYDGNDTVLAGSGNDIAFGGKGDDELWGGEGNDTLSDGHGLDLVYGGDGSDTLYVQFGNDEQSAGHDFFDGGDGLDTLMLGPKVADLEIEAQADGTYLISYLLNAETGARAYNQVDNVEYIGANGNFYLFTDFLV